LLRGKTTSQTIIRKEAIVGLKLTIRHCLLGSCALLLLAPACATSSKTARGAHAPGKQKEKAPAAPRATAATSSSVGKAKPSPPSPVTAKAAPVTAKAGKGATVVEVKKPALPPEPELPSRLPQALFCPTPSEVQAGTDLTIRCAVKPTLATPKVVFNYRPSGTERFTTADAIRSPKGWYVVKIRGADVKGSALQFFAQSYSASNRITASNGTDESPNILLIRKGGLGAAGTGTADQPGADDDPLAHIHREIAEKDAEKREGRRRPAKRAWLGMGLGSAYGWFPTRTPDAYPGARVKGWSTGGILHLLPEIGYQWTDHVAFSLQGRYQFVLRDMGTGCGATDCPTPKSWAYAVLARAYLFTDRLFGRASNLQLFATGSLGGGTAFCLYVAPHPDLTPGSTTNFRRSDSVHGGPLAAGVGGGVVYHFTNYLGLAAELRALAGFWDLATVFEGGMSFQWAFWSPGARRAPAVEPTVDLPPEPDYPPME
jgi:hypothetical protein